MKFNFNIQIINDLRKNNTEKLLQMEDILDREPGCRDKGVTRMIEQVYVQTAL